MKSLVQKELAKRQGNSLPVLFNGTFPLQEDFIKHPSRFKALLATRRASKSYTCGLYAVDEMLKYPGCKVLLIALTRDSAKGIFWADVLKDINRKHKLKMKFNLTELSATMSNGSVVRLLGVDSSEEEKDKLLGQKYRLVCIDESASYGIDLRQLVYGTLKPAMADLQGTIVMVGTPGNLTKSLFFDITTGVEPGWHVVKFSTFDNPFMADKWRKEIDELTTNQPYIVETPMFKQMYLGEWVIDTDSLVYKFNPDRNYYIELPMYAKGDWQYLLGVDLGYEDASAFVVVAFHEHDKNLFVLDCFAKSKMDITDVADKIKELKTKYDIHKVIIDNANKQAVEEMQKRHQLPLIPADKTGKSDFIEIMNAELIQGKIKLHQSTGASLAVEWQNLVWKEKDNKKIENPACENHMSDACLYAWRYCYQYLSEKPKDTPKYQSNEWYVQEVERMQEEADEYFSNLQKNDDPYDNY